MNTIARRLAKIRSARAAAGLSPKLPAGTSAKVQTRLDPKPAPVKHAQGSPAWWDDLRARGRIVPLGVSPDLPTLGCRKWTSGPCAGRWTVIHESDNGKSGWDKVITDRHWLLTSVVKRVGGGRGLIIWYDRIIVEPGMQHGSVRRRLLAAPRGWRWGADANGIKLFCARKPAIDYHPTMSGLTRRSPRGLCVQARKNWETGAPARAEARKNQHALVESTKRGVRVGLCDALAAGNCQVGISSFAGRHGLDVSRWYSPKQLLAIANGDAQRVRLSVAMAIRRHDALAAAGAEIFYPR